MYSRTSIFMPTIVIVAIGLAVGSFISCNSHPEQPETIQSEPVTDEQPQEEEKKEKPKNYNSNLAEEEPAKNDTMKIPMEKNMPHRIAVSLALDMIQGEYDKYPEYNLRIDTNRVHCVFTKNNLIVQYWITAEESSIINGGREYHTDEYADAQ